MDTLQRMTPLDSTDRETAAAARTLSGPVPGRAGGAWSHRWPALEGGLRAARRPRGLRSLFPALLPALLFLPVVLTPPLNHDVAAVLQWSQRWLGGEHLYSDLIDVNPPLVFVLNLVPAAIAEWTPLDGVAALQLCLLAWGVAAWLLCQRVRGRIGRPAATAITEGGVERALLDVLPALFLLCAGYDFGQREHLMAVAALPYALAASRRARGERPPARIPAAVLAAVGFALKPHFLAIPGLIELALLLRRGLPALRDPVPWAMAGVWALYLASLPLLFPDYLGIVVPLVWDYYLDLGGLSAAEVLLTPRVATVLCLLMPCAWAALRRSGLLRDALRAFGPGGKQRAAAPPAERVQADLPVILTLAALGALASAVAQHKGWSYHILPIALFTLALAGVLAARWVDRAALPLFPGRVAAALTGLFALYCISNAEAPWKQLAYAGSPAAELTRMMRQEAAGERILVLSPGIYPIYPAMNYAGVRSTLRTMNMWLLQGAYEQCLPDGRRYREIWEMDRAEFFVFRTVAEDFAAAPPAAVVVDKQPGIPWCGEEFDFVEYFKRNPLFAEVWSHYQLAAEWDRYRIYTRRD